MIFHDDCHIILACIVCKLAQTISGQLLLLIKAALTTSAYPQCRATEHTCHVSPLVMIFDRRFASRIVGITEQSFIITHDKQVFYAFSIRDGFHFLQKCLVLHMVNIEPVDVFDCANSELLSRERRKIDWANILLIARIGIERPVQRPLGKRNAEQGILGISGF